MEVKALQAELHGMLHRQQQPQQVTGRQLPARSISGWVQVQLDMYLSEHLHTATAATWPATRSEQLQSKYAALASCPCCRYAAYNKAVADDMTNSLKQACIALGWPITGGQPVNIDCR